MKNLTHVVAAIDFSGHGLDGARWVARHLDPDTVLLLHALHIPIPPAFLKHRWGDLEQLERSARTGAGERLAEYARALKRETGVAVETRVETGPPTDCIAEVAQEVDAGLIVLGPHSDRRGGWDRLGSTAERVLRTARLPVLLATGDLREPEVVLAALDDSAVGAGILLWLRAIVEETGARAVGLHVVDNTLETTYRSFLDPGAPGRDEELSREAAGWLGRRLSEEGLEEAQVRIALGEPAIEILAAARRADADLVIMGTRGSGAATGLLIGGVARLVVRGSRCPVLLLPKPA